MSTVDAGDPLATLARAFDQFLDVVATVTPADESLPTPCRSWDVRDLLQHSVGVARNFAATARGEAPPATAEVTGEDGWVPILRGAGDDLIAAWREPGALDRTVPLPTGEQPATWRVRQQTVEFVVHAWDLARALGRVDDLDPQLAEATLSWGRENLKPQYRGDEASGKAFGVEVAVPPDAGAYDRLAGFFGRDPA